jgi:predicted alpha/beta hydrolase family esterase
VEQDDWNSRDVDAWARRIVETALPLQTPVVLAAHSFGCLAAIRAAEYQSELIAGALLVAPADPQRFGLERRLSRKLLDFPSTLVLSRDDPWMPPATAREWAWHWGSALVDLGNAGHINVEAGYTDWREGLTLLDSLCRRIPATPGRLSDRRPAA